MKVLKVVCLAGAAAFALTSFGEEASWQRPRTTRRYLQPPLAQNMFTLWNDGKIICGDVAHQNSSETYVAGLHVVDCVITNCHAGRGGAGYSGRSSVAASRVAPV